MKRKYLSRRVFSYPPHIIVKKVLGVVFGYLEKAYQRHRDTRTPTFTAFRATLKEKLFRYFGPLPIQSLMPHADQIAALSRLYLEHRFDLLGSGWVQVKHGMTCRGLEQYRYHMGDGLIVDNQGEWLSQRVNQANLEAARTIWRLVDPGYIPIDWHLDFKSGYRWDEATWYQDIPYAHLPGVDIKVPWELARMQHLIQLSWAYALASDGTAGFDEPNVYLQEFRNQVLDFIATNPPRFGVNWRSTMDVAIRVANWLVAYDLFRAYGASFDDAFERVFQLSVFQHGLHIVTNLEWFPQGRGNHYLSNVVGLLFVAVYLPRIPEVDTWLAFAVQELVNEVAYQFYLDGSNIEASTSYHRLSAEMVIYGTSLILSLPSEKQVALQEFNHELLKTEPALKPAPIMTYTLGENEPPTPFPRWYYERLEKMAEFTMHITKPDGDVPQVGDNDSGRFFKIQPTYSQLTVPEALSRYANLNGDVDLPNDAVYWDEEFLDHRHLVDAINGLFGRADFSDFTGKNKLESQLLQLMSGGAFDPKGLGHVQNEAENAIKGTEIDWEHHLAGQSRMPDAQRQILEIKSPDGDLRDGLRLYAYPDFGLYIYQTNRLYLAIRCGSIHPEGTGGHAHNDQLSIVLQIAGEDWITDPGTYLYTPLPDRRNEYRSIKAHFSPALIKGEPLILEDGLFELRGKSKTACLCFCSKGFVGKVEMENETITRSIQILEDAILITDTTSSPIKHQPTHLSLHVDRQPLFSNAYGKQLLPNRTP